jgi:hypothetical protein
MRHIRLVALIVVGLLATRDQPGVGARVLQAPAANAIPNTMASYDFVLGKWRCNGLTAQGKINYTFTQENSKTMDGSWFVFNANAFMTYDGKAHVWRYIEIDPSGGYSMGTTPGWTGNRQTWTGYRYSNGIRRSWGRIVFTKVSDREKRQDFYKPGKKGRFQFDGSEVCAKID